MGYYTSFYLRRLDGKKINKDELNTFNFEGFRYALENNGESQGACKWYECEYDMQTLSENNPFVIFVLDGYGSVRDDIWRIYALNGKTYKVLGEISFPKFNEKLLKE